MLFLATVTLMKDKLHHYQSLMPSYGHNYHTQNLLPYFMQERHFSNHPSPLASSLLHRERDGSFREEDDWK